jgi:hypothetical protein
MPSAIAHRPGSRPKLSRSWIFTCHQQPPPLWEAQVRSKHPSSTKPTTGSATLTQKACTTATRRQWWTTKHRLLNKDFTNRTPHPLAHHWHWSRTPMGRGWARVDLFDSGASTITSLLSLRTLTLENLGPTLPISKRMMISTPSRCPTRHQRWRRSPPPLAGTES